MARPRRIVPRMLAPSRILRETPAQAGGGRDREDLVDYAEHSITKGSKSFALASRLFDRGTREKVWLLYAWCRRCDDLADDQDHGGTLGEEEGAERRLTAIRLLTERAFEGLPTADPAFDAFGLVARECGLTREMAEDVIMGFELDATGWRPRSEADLARVTVSTELAPGDGHILYLPLPAGVDLENALLLRWFSSGNSRTAASA